jgi:hypothetical protein
MQKFAASMLARFLFSVNQRCLPGGAMDHERGDWECREMRT